MDRRAVDQHGARAALPEAASELGAMKAELVAQNVEQTIAGFDVQAVPRSVGPRVAGAP
jgi:hypothetical protein